MFASVKICDLKFPATGGGSKAGALTGTGMATVVAKEKLDLVCGRERRVGMAAA